MLQLNPPLWPASVLVIEQDDSDIAAKIHKATSDLQIKTGHFSSKRVALLFKSGEYDVDVLVGYYTQVLGLGASPSDTVFTSAKGVYSPALDPGSAGSLDSFWKSAENITTGSAQMLWAVSQAAPLRRVVVPGDLLMHDKGEYASGGFMANVAVGNNTEMGSQQQWCSRNCSFGNAPTGGAWSLVYVGCNGAQESKGRSAGSDLAISNIFNTPLVAEKPFITCNENGLYHLQIPPIKRGTDGTDFGLGRTVSFEHVYVARSDFDTSETIQSKLDDDFHIVLCPGIYKLRYCLHISKNSQVLLGLGLATLIAPDNKACIIVTGDVYDVRIAGLMLQASHSDMKDGCLLQWNDGLGEDSDIAGVMSDLFVRVGGHDCDKSVRVNTMVRIDANNVVMDNCWLWVSDHTALSSGEVPLAGETYHLTVQDECKCDIGLQVYGHNVYAYGLAVEHTLKDLVQWYGEDGHVYFYQSELPYHVTQKDYGDPDYVGYRVHQSVEKHMAVGLGVYSFFRDHQVLISTAIQTPEHDGIKLDNVYTRYLNGHGGIMSVWNGKGTAATSDTESKLSFI
jgi:hypothetical protein